MKNTRSPRTLSECVFVTGYQSASPQPSRLADWILATAIGAGLALALVHWWAA